MADRLHVGNIGPESASQEVGASTGEDEEPESSAAARSDALCTKTEAGKDRNERRQPMWRGSRKNTYCAWIAALMAVVSLGAQAQQDPAKRVKALIQQLNSPDAATRRHAAGALGGWGDAGLAAIPALANALKDQDVQVRMSAVESIGRLQPDRQTGIPLLQGALTDPDARVRENALIWLVFGFRPLTKQEVLHIAECLKDPAVEVRRRAVEMLGKCGEAGIAAIPALADALDDEDERVRVCVIETIGRTQPDRKLAFPVLERAVVHGEGRVRWEAIYCYSRFPQLEEPMVLRLAEYLKDRDPMVRAAAATTIVEAGLNRTAAIPALIELVELDEEPSSYAALVLGRMGTEAKEAVKALHGALKSPNKRLRVSAAEALGCMGAAAKDTVPDLIATLEIEEDFNHRLLFALGDLGEFAGEAVPKLRAALNNDDPKVVAAACYALFRIEGDAQPLIPLLLEGLGANDPGKRRRPAYVLGVMGPKAKPALPALSEALLKVLESRGFRSWHEFAWAMGRMGPEGADALPALRKGLEKYPQNVAMHAAVAAIEGRMGEHLAPILAALKAESWSQRLIAAAALGELGPMAEAAIPEVEKLLDDPVGNVRLMAAEALVKLRGEELPGPVDEVARQLRR